MTIDKISAKLTHAERIAEIMDRHDVSCPLETQPVTDEVNAMFKDQLESESKWIEYSWENKESHPPKAGSYLIYRKGCDKMHFEQWNGSGWASSNSDCTDWCKPSKPK